MIPGQQMPPQSAPQTTYRLYTRKLELSGGKNDRSLSIEAIVLLHWPSAKFQQSIWSQHLGSVWPGRTQGRQGATYNTHQGWEPLKGPREQSLTSSPLLVYVQIHITRISPWSPDSYPTGWHVFRTEEYASEYAQFHAEALLNPCAKKLGQICLDRNQRCITDPRP